MPRNILLAIDGLRGDRLHRLIAAGHAPHLAGLIRRGTYAPLSFTGSSELPWMALATGTSDGAGETIWSAAHRQQRESILLKYPCGWPQEGVSVAIENCLIGSCRHVLDGPHLFCTDPAKATKPIQLTPCDTWRGVPATDPPFLAAPLEFTLSDGASTMLYAVAMAETGAYKRVQITYKEDRNYTLATLTPGNWSPWIPVEFRDIEKRGYVRLCLLELSTRGDLMTVYSTNVVPEEGWSTPQDKARQLTNQLGPFLFNIGPTTHDSSWARLATQFDNEGARAAMELCAYQADWLQRSATLLSRSEDWTFFWTHSHIPEAVQQPWCAGNPDHEEIHSAHLDETYVLVDRFIGGIASLGDPETLVVVASYDRTNAGGSFVCFKGPGVKAKASIEEAVSITDIASTIAELMDVPAPANSTGQPIRDMLTY
ncbi:MAG: hypothetical protein KJ052_03040 [Candidatus Hydrogenedentes bacterium]|nr:hypothetical protein [Candidatus Hydrogenedentota bacterium]